MYVYLYGASYLDECMDASNLVNVYMCVHVILVVQSTDHSQDKDCQEENGRSGRRKQ